MKFDRIKKFFIVRSRVNTFCDNLFSKLLEKEDFKLVFCILANSIKNMVNQKRHFDIKSKKLKL